MKYAIIKHDDGVIQILEKSNVTALMQEQINNFGITKFSIVMRFNSLKEMRIRANMLMIECNASDTEIIKTGKQETKTNLSAYLKCTDPHFYDNRKFHRN
jgi:hypothetical protein